jgi:hypothetical protein
VGHVEAEWMDVRLDVLAVHPVGDELNVLKLVRT